VLIAKALLTAKIKKKSGSGFKWLLFCFTGLYQINIFKRTKKIKILTSSFWLKIFKKPQLYRYTASFFKDFYLKNILL